MNRTRTHRITHSEAFLRSRSRNGSAVAGEPPLSYQSAHSAFMALFEEFEDIDQLVSQCIATLPGEEVATPKRMHGSRGQSPRANNAREREAKEQRRPATAGHGHGRR